MQNKYCLCKMDWCFYHAALTQTYIRFVKNKVTSLVNLNLQYKVTQCLWHWLCDILRLLSSFSCWSLTIGLDTFLSGFPLFLTEPRSLGTTHTYGLCLGLYSNSKSHLLFTTNSSCNRQTYFSSLNCKQEGFRSCSTLYWPNHVGPHTEVDKSVTVIFFPPTLWKLHCSPNNVIYTIFKEKL